MKTIKYDTSNTIVQSKCIHKGVVIGSKTDNYNKLGCSYLYTPVRC